MNEQEMTDDELAQMAEEDHLELDGDLADLLATARRGRKELSLTESTELMRVVVAHAGDQKGRRPLLRIAWAASLAVAAVLVALLWPRTPPKAPIVIKRSFFELVSQGKVSRLELTLTRKNVGDK